MPEGDRELVERARRGDADAIGALFSRYWRAARASAFGVTGDVTTAEDAAAEAFRHAWAGLRTLEDPDRFGPWLRTIVVRKARLAVKTRRAEPDVAIDEVPDSNDTPDHALERAELSALIQQLVRELPIRLREAVSLFYFEGYGTDEAARFLGIPAGTFRRRLHQGRQHLRRSADRVLKGPRTMDDKREREIARLTRMIDTADAGDTEPLYQALRESLALRPAPRELIASVIQRQVETDRAEPHASAPDFETMVRATAKRFVGPSERARDANHPVGQAAAAIRRALPEFQEWTLDVSEAAAHFLTFKGEQRDRLQPVLPPGFAEGRPGASIRGSQALLFLDEHGSVRTSYQLLDASETRQAFRDGMSGARVIDALELTWMVAGPLELRSVQELLERLGAAVLPDTPIRFAHYDEPRYRSALQMQVGAVTTPAAIGGVLTEWPGRPAGVDAAHVRIYLEPWAAVRSGKQVEGAAR